MKYPLLFCCKIKTMETLPLITSRNNPTLKLARSLRDRKERSQTGLFLVEGILHVGEAAEAGWEIDTLLYSSDLLTSEFGNQLVERLIANGGVRCQPVSADAFGSVTEKENPQGILALVRQKFTSLQELTPQKFRFGAAAVSPQDPGNLGTILRTVDAVGADGLLLLDGGVDPFHPSAVRASMGTLFWKPVVQTSFDEFVSWARGHDYCLIGTSARGDANYQHTSRDGKPFVLLLGSEQKGLSSEQIEACDILVRLPMRGRASSLNLAVAAGVLLYALMDNSG